MTAANNNIPDRATTSLNLSDIRRRCDEVQFLLCHACGGRGYGPITISERALFKAIEDRTIELRSVVDTVSGKLELMAANMESIAHLVLHAVGGKHDISSIETVFVNHLNIFRTAVGLATRTEGDAQCLEWQIEEEESADPMPAEARQDESGDIDVNQASAEDSHQEAKPDFDCVAWKEAFAGLLPRVYQMDMLMERLNCGSEWCVDGAVRAIYQLVSIEAKGLAQDVRSIAVPREGIDHSDRATLACSQIQALTEMLATVPDDRYDRPSAEAVLLDLIDKVRTEVAIGIPEEY